MRVEINQRYPPAEVACTHAARADRKTTESRFLTTYFLSLIVPRLLASIKAAGNTAR